MVRQTDNWKAIVTRGYSLEMARSHKDHPKVISIMAAFSIFKKIKNGFIPNRYPVAHNGGN